MFNKSNFSDGAGFFTVLAAIVVIVFGAVYLYAGSLF